MKISQLACLALVAQSLGCMTTGANSMSGITNAGSSMMTKLGQTSAGVKGQVGSMGTAVGSAYTKTKTMFSDAMAGTSSSDSSDPTSIAGKPPIIGPELYVAQGQNYELSRNYEKAEEFYLKALQAEPNNMAALLSMARLSNRLQDSTKSIEYYRKAEKLSPTETAIYTELGQIYVASGQLDAAKGELQKAVNLEPKSRAHRMALAGVLVDQSQGPAALQELMQVDAAPMANYQLAYIYASRKNVPVAQQYLQTALQMDPNLAPARELAGTLQNSAFAQQAYSGYQQAGAAYQNATNAYQQANQVYQQAGQVYQQASAVMSTTPNQGANVTR